MSSKAESAESLQQNHGFLGTMSVRLYVRPSVCLSGVVPFNYVGNRVSLAMARYERMDY